MQNFKFGGVTVLAVQLFNKITWKKKKTKNMKKHVSLYFPDIMLKYIFWVNLFFFVCFSIDVTRNGNNLKLKVKSEFYLRGVTIFFNKKNDILFSG